MKVAEILYTSNDENSVLEESAARAFTRKGTKIKAAYRCVSGLKAGKIVAKPGACAHRKDPRKVRAGRKVMRQKGAVIHRKGQMSKRKAISKRLVSINRRLSKKTVFEGGERE